MKERWFSDPVHKSIHLDPIAAELVDTVPFQRLRLVNQLSLMHYVFPGAEHSRFLHSLGVYKNMTDVVDALGDKLDSHLRTPLKVGALLHDLGHYPFSHLGEIAYKIVEDRRRPPVAADPTKRRRDADSGLLFRYAERRQSGVHFHEELGAHMVVTRPDLRGILEKHEIDPGLVAQLIKGEAEDTLASQALHSAIDADRLDYLVRDSLATGATYGLIDRDYLIRMLRVGQQETQEPGQGRSSLAVLGIDQEHGTHALEHFVFARFFHYSQIVFHKTVAAFEVITRALMGEMIEAGLLPQSHSQIEERVADDQFLLNEFHDRAVLELLRAKRDDLAARRPSLGVLIDTILRRRRPRIAYRAACLFRRGDPPSEEYTLLRKLVTDQSEFLVGLVGLDPDHVGYATGVASLERSLSGGPGSWEEGSGQRDALRVVDKNGKATFAVENKESLLRVLADYEFRVLWVFYVEPPDEPEEDRERRLQRVRNGIARQVSLG